MYAGALGDNAVERYALFLTSLGIAGDKDDRKLALIRARDHGLDTKKVAMITAERTIDQAFAVRDAEFMSNMIGIGVFMIRLLETDVDNAKRAPPRYIGTTTASNERRNVPIPIHRMDYLLRRLLRYCS